MGGFVAFFFIFVAVGGLILLSMMIKILPEYERGVVFRLGRVLGKPKGPGLILLIPILDRIQRVSLRTVVMDVPPQDIITSDNVTLKVNAVVYFRVVNPLNAVIQVGRRKRVTLRAIAPERVGTITATGLRADTAWWMLRAIRSESRGLSGARASIGRCGRCGSVATAISPSISTAASG